MSRLSPAHARKRTREHGTTASMVRGRDGGVLRRQRQEADRLGRDNGRRTSRQGHRGMVEIVGPQCGKQSAVEWKRCHNMPQRGVLFRLRAERNHSEKAIRIRDNRPLDRARPARPYHRGTGQHVVRMDTLARKAILHDSPAYNGPIGAMLERPV